MTNRRIQISNIALSDDKSFAEAEGMAGESFDTEVFQLHGFSSTPEAAAESTLLEINSDSDNHISLPPQGERTADAGTTLIYYGETEIVLDASSIKITVGGNFLNIESGTLTTDLDIETTGEITASEVSVGSVKLSSHIHTGVQSGGGVSGGPQ